MCEYIIIFQSTFSFESLDLNHNDSFFHSRLTFLPVLSSSMYLPSESISPMLTGPLALRWKLVLAVPSPFERNAKASLMRI